MKKQILTTVLLLSTLLAAQMSLTANAADDGEGLLLISPKPDTVNTQTANAVDDTFLSSQYEQYAGMYSYEGVALQLNSVDMLLGGGNGGFDLYNLPDRQQASVMVVRMRGEEEAAKAAYEAGEIICPFSDVDNWAKPYVAWLYEKGITQGIGEGLFGNRICSAQEYVTFMLRALGYSVTWAEEESTDVLYADVMEFASALGVWDEYLAYEPDFNRGVMSAVTYQALAADVKNTDDRLLYSLTQSGAIDAEKASPILALYDRIDTAAALERASVPVSEGLRLNGTVLQKEDLVYSVIGLPEGDYHEALISSLLFDVGIDLTGETPQLALNGEITSESPDLNSTIPVGLWLYDGSVYLDVMGLKTKETLADSAVMSSFSPLFGDLFDDLYGSAPRYYAITDVEIAVSDGTDGSAAGTTITYDMTDYMWQIAAISAGTEAFTENAGLWVSIINEMYIDEDGILSWASDNMYALISEAYADGTVFSAEVLLQTAVSYTAWGNDATLTYPDFSQFE